MWTLAVQNSDTYLHYGLYISHFNIRKMNYFQRYFSRTFQEVWELWYMQRMYTAYGDTQIFDGA